MSILREKYERAVDILAGAAVGLQVGQDQLREMAKLAEDAQFTAQESQADLQLAMDDVGWVQLNDMSKMDFPRQKTLDAVKISRLLYLLNPLIKRAVTVQELYVWGSGVTIKADDDNVQQVIDDFFNDPKNQCAVGNGWEEREREQRNDGNVFFFMFRNRSNGSCRVRTVSIDYIKEIISNPEDKNEPWYYVREMPDGNLRAFPDILYDTNQKTVKFEDRSIPVDRNALVLHSKSGGIPGMKFGLPEFYCVFNWAVAYKGILENFATILKAYARIAWKLTGQPGAAGVAGSKTRLSTTQNNSALTDKNPPTNTASWMILSGQADLSAVKTANSTTAPDEARALRSMVAAGTDTPEHFFGDSDVGNFATSETLDRPTELKMIARQSFWAAVMSTMVGKLIEWSAIAPNGVLRKAGGFVVETSQDQFDGSRTYKVTSNNNLNYSIKWPQIVERAVTDRVRAVVMALTLGGRSAEGIIPDRREGCRLLLEALGIKGSDKLLDELYPAPVKQGFIDPEEEMDLKRQELEVSKKQATAAASKPKPTGAK